jgi:hypothetical protein
MQGEESIPLEHGRPKPTRPSFRWLVLLGVWSIGLLAWLLYLIVLGYLLLVIL